MSRIIVYLAQALDNVSAAHVEFEGKSLAEDEKTKREEAMSMVSEVKRKGKEIHSVDEVRLTGDRQHFVLEVSSLETDISGRRAPMVCYGQYPESSDTEFASTVAQEIQAFASRIGRSISPEALRGAQTSLDVLKKKSYRWNSGAKAIGVVLLVAILLTLYLITSDLGRKKPSDDLQKKEPQTPAENQLGR
jgi:hypothetical protein